MIAILVKCIIGLEINNVSIHGNVKVQEHALEVTMKKQMVGAKVIVIAHKWVH